eukprot:gene4274-6053_t
MAGIPSITYCRILNSSINNLFAGNRSQDILVDGNSVTIVESGLPSSRHDVAQVIDRRVSDEDTCEMIMGAQAGAGLGAALNPISAFVNDAATTVIFFLGSKQSKKWNFMKKTALPFVANELFSNLAEKDVLFQMQQNTSFQAQINISAFEIQDETIVDLLRPANASLSMVLSPDNGVTIPGLHKETIVDEIEMRRLISDACENRASHNVPIGGGIDTSSVIFEITLYQREMIGSAASFGIPQTGLNYHSRLLLVEIPSMDYLCPSINNPVIGKQFESPSLHKSLNTFYQVIKCLSTTGKASLAPFRSSLLTYYLNELLGGNAIILALGMLNNDEPAIVSRKTLELLGSFNNAVHYPIGGKEFTENLQGLLSKYRSIVLQMQDENAMKEALRKESYESEHSAEKLLIEVQKTLATAVIDRSEAIEDRARLYEMTELLKLKYNTLMDEKLKSSQDLLHLEDDKITLANELMDNKLEITHLQEKYEKETFELNSEILKLQSKIFDLESDIISSKSEIDILKEEVSAHILALESLKKGNENLLLEKNEQIKFVQNEKEKNIELGAELLTLINHKQMKQQEFDENQVEFEKLKTENNSLHIKNNELNDNVKNVERELNEKFSEILSLTKKNAEMELIHQKLQMDLNQMTFESKEKQQQLINQINEMQSHPTVNNHNNDHKLNNHNNSNNNDHSAAALKKATRLARDLEKNLNRVKVDLEESKNEKILLEKELNELREKYRQKISSLLVIADNNTNSNNNNLIDSTQNNHVNAANLQHRLLESYVEREERNRQELDHSLQQQSELRVAYRVLYDNYRIALDVMEEHLPKSNIAKLSIVEEQLKFGEKKLEEAESYLDTVQSQERAGLRQRIRYAEESTLQETERMSFLVETYQHNLELTEQKMVALQQENIDLHIKFQQLIQSNNQIQSNNMNNEVKPTQQLPFHDQKRISLSEEKQVAMYEQLTKQIQDLTNQLFQQSNANNQNSSKMISNVPLLNLPNKSNSRRNSNVEIIQANNFDDNSISLNSPMLNDDNNSMIEISPISRKPTTANPILPNILKNETPRSPRSHPGINQKEGRMTHDECFAYIHALEKNANSAMMHHLRAIEERAAQLVMKNSSLEEELKSYQNYMRDVIPQYKKQLVYLKTQLGLANGQNGLPPSIKQRENNDVKFPPLKNR